MFLAKTYNIRGSYESFVSFPVDDNYVREHSLHAAIHMHISEFKDANPDTDVVGWATWEDDLLRRHLRLYLRARKAALVAAEDGGERAQTKWEEGLC